MIDKRLSHLQDLETFLLKNFEGWPSPLVFEEPPPQMSEYDVALPCFQLAKLLRENPQACAEKVRLKLEEAKPSLKVEKAEVLKGYVNIRFEVSVLGLAIASRLEDPLGDAKAALASETMVIDFSSPNIAKPFGIGHLRSTNIGAAISRIWSSLGAKVIRVNHLGDWGTQFGKMITAYKHFGSADFVKGDPVNNLYKLYVMFHEKEAEDPALLDEARDWFVKLEANNEEAMELWKWFKELSYYEFKRIYDRLGVEFDYVTGESFYNQLMKKTEERLEKLGLLKESEQAMIVDLEAEGMPPCLIRKSDGSTLYATRDLATAEYRMRTFNATRLVYVVGGEQTLHFRQFFKVLEKMGYEWAANCVHVPFGLIKFPEGKMSTRKGNLVLLESVLDQAEQEAYKIVQAKNAEKPEERRLSTKEELAVAREVGMGAVIFFDLHAKRTKDILFKWEEILNFEGDSGPYLQYTHVRLCSLLDRAANDGVKPSQREAVNLSTAEERALARKLLGFPAMVEAAARDFEPSMISHELLELAAAFNRFYMNVPVLKGESAERIGRMNLVLMTRNTIAFGLQLLGIHAPLKM